MIRQKCSLTPYYNEVWLDFENWGLEKNLGKGQEKNTKKKIK